MADEFLVDVVRGSKPKPERRLRPTSGAPQRSKSASLAAMKATPNRPGPIRSKSIRTNSDGIKEMMTSKSDHGGSLIESTDDWFDFGEGGEGMGFEFGVASDHASSAENSNVGRVQRRGLARGPSHRRMDYKAQSAHVSDTSGENPSSRVSGASAGGISLRNNFFDHSLGGETGPPPRVLSRGMSRRNNNSYHGGDETPQRGVARARSGDGKTPGRSRSDAAMGARRESMKALYRVNPNEDPSAPCTRGLQRGLGLNTRGMSGLSLTASDLNHGNSPQQRRPARPRPIPPTRTKSGLEVVALTAVMEWQRQPPTRSKSTDSANLFGTHEESEASDELHITANHDAAWLKSRKNKMDEIMSLAHDVKERFVEDRERKELEVQEIYRGDRNEGLDEDYDDDQPMAMRTKKTVLETVKKVASKTGGGMRSLGKGTVNAIHDPKLAAKRLGHLSKDVGKATVKTALDPKKMAIGATKLTVGSAKMGAGLTTGVAQTAFGASKAVVKGSMKATTKSAKLTMKGTKKMGKVAVRAVTGKREGKHDEEADYDPHALADRQQTNFYDRISSLVETNPSPETEDDDLELAILAGITAEECRADPAAAKKITKNLPKGTSSVLMPTNLIGGSGSGNWDV